MVKLTFLIASTQGQIEQRGGWSGLGTSAHRVVNVESAQTTPEGVVQFESGHYPPCRSHPCLIPQLSNIPIQPIMRPLKLLCRGTFLLGLSLTINGDLRESGEL